MTCVEFVIESVYCIVLTNNNVYCIVWIMLKVKSYCPLSYIPSSKGIFNQSTIWSKWMYLNHLIWNAITVHNISVDREIELPTCLAFEWAMMPLHLVEEFVCVIDPWYYFYLYHELYLKVQSSISFFNEQIDVYQRLNTVPMVANSESEGCCHEGLQA